MAPASLYSISTFLGHPEGYHMMNLCICGFVFLLVMYFYHTQRYYLNIRRTPAARGNEVLICEYMHTRISHDDFTSLCIVCVSIFYKSITHNDIIRISGRPSVSEVMRC